MKRVTYCFHTHTKRCGHAIGDDEEYVKYAIKAGIKRLGFSDHVMLPGIIQDGSRARFEMLDDYVNSINSLREQYKDKIQIKVGFEAEYCYRFVNYYKTLLATKKIDYLILGQHFDFDHTDTPRYIKFVKDNKSDMLESYVQHVLNAIDSGLFTYVAHPDLYVLMYKDWNEECEKAAHTICEAASKAKIPLEINTQMLLHWPNEENMLCYPCDQFWKVASQYDLDVVIGIDAHIPSELQEDDISIAWDLIDKYNLRFIKNFRIQPINKSLLK